MGIERQSKMYSFQMTICGKKNSVGTPRQSSKFQKVWL